MKPKYLTAGSKIYLVAPSFGAASYPYQERLKRSIVFLKARGYEIIEGPNTWLNEGTMGSNTPEKRAREIEDAFQSEATLIWSVGGGETLNEILPFLDFEVIKKYPPKYFVGYSDNTNLGFVLQTVLDYPTIYGPCAGTFYTDESEDILRQKLGSVEGAMNFKGYPQYQSRAHTHDDLAPLILDTPKKITTINYTAPLEGILIGGCLDCLSSLCGTRYDKVKSFMKNHRDVIFFFESCDLDVLSYRRALFQLREAGWFDTVKAILVGRPFRIGENIGTLSFNQDVKDILGKLNIPILTDIDIGHLPPTIPLRTNERCRITYRDENIFIDYLKP